MEEIEPNKLSERYKVINDTRKFEIELFWKRSLFFWGFIASAFIMLGVFSAPERNNANFKIAIAFFGLAGSIAWALVNRGSKYWQENWEQQLIDIEEHITGRLFTDKKPRVKKGMWLSSRRYSPSKLTIALSDYVVVVWILIIVGNYLTIDISRPMFLITVFWMVLTLFKARSTEPP